jgi:hypothetical protein
MARLTSTLPDGYAEADDLLWESWSQSVALHHESAMAEMGRQRRSGFRDRMDRVLDRWADKEMEVAPRLEREIPCPRRRPLG